MVEKSHGAGLWPSLYEPFRSMGHRLSDWLSPASEASSDDDSYRIAVELPGVAEEDVDLTVHDGVVTVKGEKKTSREEKGETWFFSERQYGAFSRSFRLPADADAGGIAADMRDGLLTITVPRMKPEEKAARSIRINKS